jgi:DNA polymerase-3 subunit gamma/tau
VAYQALYRKYRPKTFEGVIGQEHITQTLANQVKAQQVSHAYLFTGSRGTGKTSTARIFAKAINCLHNQNGSPCNVCENCLELDKPTNMDIIEIDAASNNRVDEIREIRENVSFMPVKGKFKVYIIDEVHMLTDSAFNALLKTLEEPPHHVVFILGTTEVHKLPQTILSRCLRFDFRLVPLKLLENILKEIFEQEKIDFEPQALRQIAIAGEGSVRDTLSIADLIAAYSKGQKVTLEETIKVLGTSDNEILLAFAKAVFEKNVGKVFEIIDKVAKEGKNLIVFAKDLSVLFRNLLIIKTSKNAYDLLMMSQNDFEKFKQLAEEVDEQILIKNMENFSAIEAELKYALNPRVLVETTAVSSIADGQVKKN